MTIKPQGVDMVSGIRTEAAITVPFANIYLWLARNRGAEMRIPGAMLTSPRGEIFMPVGLPITAARAVICPIWLVGTQGSTTPLLMGQLWCITNPRDDSTA